MNQIKVSKRVRNSVGVLTLAAAAIFAWYGFKLVQSSNQQHRTELQENSRPSSSTLTTRLQTPAAVSSVQSDSALAVVEPPQLLLQAWLTAAVRAAESEADLTKRGEQLQEIVAGVPAASVADMLGFLNLSGSTETENDLKRRFLHRWLDGDPAAAAQWVAHSMKGSARYDALSATASVWAGRDVTHAAEWARQLPEETERVHALASTAYAAAQTDPAQALTLAAELPEGATRADVMVHAASQWADRAPGEAVKWAQSVADGALRERLFAAIATAWSDSDTAAAATFAVESLPPGKAQEDAVVGIVQRWAQKTPDAAAAWVQEFPTGELRETATQELVKLWTEQNPVEAGKWLAGLTGAARDIAFGAYASQLAAQFPETAVQWANEIADTDVRERELANVAEIWISSDAGAARKWISDSSLSDSIKTRLLAIKQ